VPIHCCTQRSCRTSRHGHARTARCVRLHRTGWVPDVGRRFEARLCRPPFRTVPAVGCARRLRLDARREEGGAVTELVRRGYNDGTFDGDPNAFDHSDPWNDTIDPGAPDAGKQDYENFIVGAQVDWDIGNDMTLTYVPAYFYLDWTADYWLENIPALLSAHYNQLTQELRLSGAAGEHLHWLTGLYAYRVTNAGTSSRAGFRSRRSPTTSSKVMRYLARRLTSSARPCG
jgi:hypothetical protein